jgi:hypothetical protein
MRKVTAMELATLPCRRIARTATRALLAAAALALGGCAAAPADADASRAQLGCQVDLLVQFSPSVARPSSTGVPAGTRAGLRL